MANKKSIVKAISTRLKPNAYINDHPYWARLSKGLEKMNTFELDALEALIMGKTIYESEEQKELF